VNTFNDINAIVNDVIKYT